MGAFWHGFNKRAAESFVASQEPAAPGAPAKMLAWNELGGVDPRTPEDMAAAEAAQLVTLPQEVEGASCATCVHFRGLSPDLGAGFCTNPQVKQDVTDRMHCGMWEHPGAHSAPAVAAEEAAMAEEQAMAAGEAGMTADQAAADFQGGQEEPAPGAEQGQVPEVPGEVPEVPGEVAPAPEKKPAAKKKSGGHTINVNVGGEEKAASAFWGAFHKHARSGIYAPLPYLGGASVSISERRDEPVYSDLLPLDSQEAMDEYRKDIVAEKSRHGAVKGLMAGTVAGSLAPAALRSLAYGGSLLPYRPSARSGAAGALLGALSGYVLGRREGSLDADASSDGTTPTGRLTFNSRGRFLRSQEKYKRIYYKEKARREKESAGAPGAPDSKA